MSDRAVEAARERLWGEIERRQAELIELTAELVRRPSLLGQEHAVQAYVADHLRATGLETDVWVSDESLVDEPEAGRSGVPFGDRPNVGAVLRGAGGGRSLVLNGHTDVVSPEPVADWTHDPWAAEIVGDRMYGRGAYDMKCGVALNLWLPRLLQELDIRLQGDLSITSVIEEECTGNGALDASRRYPADAAIVTESTNGRFTFAHIGVMWFRVRIAGRTAHAAHAYRGVNAIEKAVPIIHALQLLDRELQGTSHRAFEGIPHPLKLNIGVIRGGDWPSTVPGECELHCRVSFFPDETVPGMRRRIEVAVQRAAGADEWLRDHPPVISYDGFGSRGSVVSLEAPPVRLLREWHRRVRGGELEPEAGTGTNDMRYYNFLGIPAGCYGCSGTGAHAADEWLDLTSLVPTARVLAGFLLDWCGVAE